MILIFYAAYGGTGFFFCHVPRLPEKIEHCTPDYHQYDDWMQEQSINFEDTADMTKLRIVGYTHKIYSQILNIDLSTDYFYYGPVMSIIQEE